MEILQAAVSVLDGCDKKRVLCKKRSIEQISQTTTTYEDTSMPVKAPTRSNSLSSGCTLMLSYLNARVPNKGYPVEFTCSIVSDKTNVSIRRVYNIVNILSSLGVFQNPATPHRITKNTIIHYWGPSRITTALKKVYNVSTIVHTEMQLLKAADNASKNYSSLTVVSNQLVALLVTQLHLTPPNKFLRLPNARERILNAMEDTKDPSRRLYDVVTCLESCGIVEKGTACKSFIKTAVRLSPKFTTPVLKQNLIPSTAFTFQSDICTKTALS